MTRGIDFSTRAARVFDCLACRTWHFVATAPSKSQLQIRFQPSLDETLKGLRVGKKLE